MNTPLIPLRTTLGHFPFQFIPSGLAVSALGDMPRTPTGVELFEPALSGHTFLKSSTTTFVLFSDQTGFFSRAGTIYPAPFLCSSPTPLDIEKAGDLLFPASPEADITPKGWTPGLVPSFKPMCRSLTPYEHRLLDSFGRAMLWVLYEKWPVSSLTSLTWMSQPIDPAGNLAPPRAIPRLLTGAHPSMTQLPGLAADCALLCANLSDHLPSIPGQNLLDGRQDRVAVWRTAAPPMDTAHDAVILESLPYTPLLRDALSSW